MTPPAPPPQARITVTARAPIHDHNHFIGYVELTQTTGHKTAVLGRLHRLTRINCRLALEVCSSGDLGAETLYQEGNPSFASVGQPYNPDNRPFGDEPGRLGDIPVSDKGHSYFRIQRGKVSLIGPHSVIGRTIVIRERHSLEDAVRQVGGDMPSSPLL